MVGDSRGQVILIGAVALAFLVLGVVVVINGVIYTETISSGSTGQIETATTEVEIEQAVGCLLAAHKDGRTNFHDAFDDFEESYRQQTAHSSGAVVELDAEPVVVDGEISHADVTVTYDGHDVSYERTHEVEPREDCLEGSG